MIEFAEHPLLWPAASLARFDAPLGEIKATPRVQAALSMGAVERGADLGIDRLEADVAKRDRIPNERLREHVQGQLDGARLFYRKLLKD